MSNVDPQSLSRRCQSLEAILAAAGRWIGRQDLNALLQSLAADSAALLDADRASIFLLDRGRGELVGHPALGFDGQPLRISATEGVAGAVFQSGQPRRWHEDDPTDEVNRRIDRASRYVTQSLLAVPLLSRQSKPIGVFELINARGGRFTVEDERTLQQIADIAAAAIVTMKRVQELLALAPQSPADEATRYQWIGDSDVSRKLLTSLDALAAVELPVLLRGESGSGKEVVARQLHARSKRATQRFVAVNCAAIAENLIESELFGHQRGAFTDAVASRAGQFEVASGGTLLLDEIGDMPLAGQAKLLRVLESGVVTRVGSSEPIAIDVRVIAATNQRLPELIAAGRFRLDLYYRLAVGELAIPPLRQRPGDIAALADHFLATFAVQYGLPRRQLTPAAVERLRHHAWPGNVRELRNMMQRLAALSSTTNLDAADLVFTPPPFPSTVSDDEPGASDEDFADIGRTDRERVLTPSGSAQDVAPDFKSLPLAEATDLFQKRLIAQRIADEPSMTAAADSLGLQRSNLYRKMKQLGM